VSRAYTIATASTVPTEIALPDDLDARWAVISIYPPAQRTWAGEASDATIQRWLHKRNLREALVSRINKAGGARRSRVSA
jgi:hypothetical protein